MDVCTKFSNFVPSIDHYILCTYIKCNKVVQKYSLIHIILIIGQFIVNCSMRDCNKFVLLLPVLQDIF